MFLNMLLSNIIFNKNVVTDHKGFTLIELMVVISVIGILVSIVYVNFSDAKKQARDRVRQAQLQELQVAVESYKDKYGRYPAPGCGSFSASMSGGPWAGPANQFDTAWNDGCDEYVVGHAANIKFVPDFIKELPRDPLLRNESIGPGIYYYSNGTDYKIIYYYSAESLMVDGFSHPLNRYHQSCGAGAVLQPSTYAVYSPGALCL